MEGGKAGRLMPSCFDTELRQTKNKTNHCESMSQTKRHFLRVASAKETTKGTKYEDLRLQVVTRREATRHHMTCMTPEERT